jgi:D-inositol-3-phosphate glycosyltransferase
MPVPRRVPRRIATISVHTSPLEQPGTGDAGGLNVYVVEVAKRLAARGVEVEIFTRAVSRDAAPVHELVPGVLVRHVPAGPFEELDKADLPAQLCEFTLGVLRTEAAYAPGRYDLVHGHYWLSGHVGAVAKERWGVPFVQSMHTLGRVKNAALARGDMREPDIRLRGESDVVASADRLVANTDEEARQLARLYGAEPARIWTVNPGVDLSIFRPGPAGAARHRLGLPGNGPVIVFAGRIQPLKAPDVVLHAAADLIRGDPALARVLTVAFVGGPSGTGRADPDQLTEAAQALGLRDVVRIEPQACGTPVVAASVGGLRTAVQDGRSGILVEGHDPSRYADALRRLFASPALRARLSAGAVEHASRFGWGNTVDRLLSVYRGAMAAQAEGRPALAG